MPINFKRQMAVAEQVMVEDREVLAALPDDSKSKAKRVAALKGKYKGKLSSSAEVLAERARDIHPDNVQVSEDLDIDHPLEDPGERGEEVIPPWNEPPAVTALQMLRDWANGGRKGNLTLVRAKDKTTYLVHTFDPDTGRAVLQEVDKTNKFKTTFTERENAHYLGMYR